MVDDGCDDAHAVDAMEDMKEWSYGKEGAGRGAGSVGSGAHHWTRGGGVGAN